MNTLHYIFDPLCGWCYGAAPLIDAAAGLPGVKVALHGGGMLAGANRREITPQWRDYVMPHDRRIASLSGQEFGPAYFDGLLRDIGAPLDSAPPITAILAAEALGGRGLEMAHRVQRAHYAEGRRISELSGGQRQRVALARAMVFEPQLILMDEPLSALDKQLRETMQIELRALHRRLGATIVYVTHDQREALTMSDRVAVLKNGKLVQIDTPERLYDRPCNAFVASFIGEATLLPVTRAGDDAVRLGDAVLRSAEPLPDADKLLLAVQTEKLVIDSGDAAPDANRLAASVTEVLYQGESLRVFAKLADGTALSLRQPGNHDARHRIPSPGSPVSVALSPRDTIVVPA